mgnify:CR=1 FL=1
MAPSLQRSGQFNCILAGEHRADLVAIAGPDGSHILTGSGFLLADKRYDNAARLWDAATGKELRQMKVYSIAVSSVAFNPNGQQLLTASFDGTSRLWRTSDGKELASLISFTDGEWVVITHALVFGLIRIMSRCGKEVCRFSRRDEVDQCADGGP